VCRAAAGAAADGDGQIRIGSAATVAAVERLARADGRLAAGCARWDADPWLLATPDGVVDLRTGALRGADPADRITRVAAVGPGRDGAADCPRFRAFLDRIFAGDRHLIGFVQRALGYALTGDTAEHALFFCWGTGGNGKGVLLNTIARILGGYAAVAPAESFAGGAGAAPLADLAALAGARFVLAPESTQGECWNERRIKALTGGDPLGVRTAAGAPPVAAATPCWTSFKLFMAGNHKPTLNTVDEAIRRRLHIIPFAVTIPADQVDRDLPRKLEAEWPGILAWMIAGALEWQRIGLAPSKAVKEATAEHLAEEDVFGKWLADWVAPGAPAATETAANLYGSWETFCHWNKEPPGSRRSFGQAMRARGFAPARIGEASTRGYRGLRLRPHSDASAMAAAMGGSKFPLEGLN
jgi:putative DNA primase/helicase